MENEEHPKADSTRLDAKFLATLLRSSTNDSHQRKGLSPVVTVIICIYCVTHRQQVAEVCNAVSVVAIRAEVILSEATIESMQ